MVRDLAVERLLVRMVPPDDIYVLIRVLFAASKETDDIQEKLLHRMRCVCVCVCVFLSACMRA